MTDILDAIDAAVGCQQCGGPLGASPSGDFCCAECQTDWAAARTEPLVGYREPWYDAVDRLPGIATEAYVSGDDPVLLTPPLDASWTPTEPGYYVLRFGYRSNGQWVVQVELQEGRLVPPLVLSEAQATEFLIARVHSGQTEYRRSEEPREYPPPVPPTIEYQRSQVDIRWNPRAEFWRTSWPSPAFRAAAVHRGGLDLPGQAGYPAPFERPILLDSSEEVAAELEEWEREQESPRLRALAGRQNRNTGPPVARRPPRTMGRPATFRR